MLYSGENCAIMFNDKYVDVKQVNINSAEKAFNDGKNVWLLANKCNLNSQLFGAMHTHKDNINCQELFKNIVNHFSYYNCDKERGLRVLYFIEVEN